MTILAEKLDVDVDMGGVGSATKGQVIGSTGFGPCFGLLTVHQNSDGQREATMFHISVDLSQEQKAKLREIDAAPGKKFGVFVVNERNFEGEKESALVKKAKGQISGIVGIAKSITLNRTKTFPHKAMDLAYNVSDNLLDIQHSISGAEKTVSPFTSEQLAAVDAPVTKGRAI